MTNTARQHRMPDAWKARWCSACRRYEYDAGPPRGWVVLRGPVPEDVRNVQLALGRQEK